MVEFEEEVEKEELQEDELSGLFQGITRGGRGGIGFTLFLFG